MADDIVLGIDLGTTNSVVAVADAGEAMVLADLDGKRLVPSVVSFTPDQIHVGDIARERRLIDAENTIYAMKRLIGRPFDSDEVRRAQERFAFGIVEADNGGVRVVGAGHEYALAEISAYVLRECRRIAEAVLDHDCKRVVITVPANFNELQRSATKAAGTVAGLDVVRILNEPTAAAVAYGCGTSGAERVAVFDLGGGTFDITILDLDGDVFEVVSTAGDTFLGGDDIDLLIAEEMAFAFERDTGIDPRPNRQAFERLRAAGEWVKCQLSFQDDVVARLEEVAIDERGEPAPLAFRMTRMQLEERIQPLVGRAIDVTRDALERGGTSIAEIDTVVLVGGSTRIPLVRREVEALFGKKPRIDIDPDLVVALGAAVQGYALSHERPRKTVTVYPSEQAVTAVWRAKEAARAARPKQPAFAPGAHAPPSPTDTQPGAGGPPSPAGLGPVQSASRVVEDAEDDTTLSREQIAAALYATGKPPAPAPSEAKRELGFAETHFAPSTGDEQPTAKVQQATEDHETATAERPEAPAESAEARAEGAEAPAEGAEAPAESAAPGLAALNIADLNLDLPSPSGDASPSGAEPLLDGASLIDLPEPKGAASQGPSQLSGADLFDVPVAGSAAVAIVGAEFTNPAEGQVGIPMPDGAPPILMDVTPHSLGIQTPGGYCERVIRRDTPIPIEQARMFTTATDDQQEVVVAICQGESRTYEENQHLGVLELAGLPPAKRGKVRIKVTFMLDADGRLDVDATDQQTGRSQQIRINLVGGYEDGELEQMRARQEQG